MNTNPFVSIIFPAKNEGENVKTTLDSLFSTKTRFSFEVIVVDDGSVDKCCDFIEMYDNKDHIKLFHTKGVGAANARNLGAKNALGEHFIFCDAHLQFEDWWIDRLLEPILKGETDAVTPGIASMENPASIGFGQTLIPSLETKWNSKQSTLFETAVIPGGCFAISNNVFWSINGFETGFRTWGYEDIELSIKLWLFGFKCHVQPNVTVLHVFRKTHPYKIRLDDVNYNLLRMAFSHFNDVRIQKCLNMVNKRRNTLYKSLLQQSNVMEQRENYFQTRKFDDDWYFNKFQIDF